MVNCTARTFAFDLFDALALNLYNELNHICLDIPNIMESFSQLLNKYIQRAGISDSELARTIGVSRQTIFRWREGATSRPRNRDDVLLIARKLRLTPEERDSLLLSAGFRPETEIAVNEGTTPVDTAQQEIPLSELSNDDSRASAVSSTHRRMMWPVVALIALLLVGGVGWWIVGRELGTDNLNTPPPAVDGETLVIVSQFANYASSGVGYNVAGRLAEVLQQEVDTTGLGNLRVAVWPDVVENRDAALQTGKKLNATLVIFGEYDAGRVVVKFAHPANQNIFVDPAIQRHVADLQDLSATINSDLPQQVRSLALLGLGQILLNQDDPERARLLLVQARDYLRNDPTVDEQTWGLVNFYLGIAYQRSDPANLDGAITAYNEAIDAWPTMLSSRLNRGAAYEDRKQPGDLERALVDAEAVINLAPDWASGYNNRASIRLNMGGYENLELALIDLQKSLQLNPDLPESYINQAYIYLRQGRSMADIEPVAKRALALRPNYATALNVLCWGYALEQQPAVALPYCNQAIDIDPRPIFQDSRGLVYALSNDYPAAITDFELYIAWLEEHQPGDTWQQDLSRRQAWVEQLKAGKNPFTADLLAELRREFGE